MYREAPENLSVSQADPFTFDPSLVERAHHSHARVQNALARFAREHGWEPRSPAPSEPNYDIAWDTPEGLLVAEVKSTTTANEERQLRVGVGQLLRYRQLMGPRPVRAVLAIERAPADPSWMALCASVQIELVWLGALERLENP